MPTHTDRQIQKPGDLGHTRVATDMLPDTDWTQTLTQGILSPSWTATVKGRVPGNDRGEKEHPGLYSPYLNIPAPESSWEWTEGAAAPVLPGLTTR